MIDPTNFHSGVSAGMPEGENDFLKVIIHVFRLSDRQAFFQAGQQDGRKDIRPNIMLASRKEIM
jgi:hypothetical protein